MSESVSRAVAHKGLAMPRVMMVVPQYPYPVLGGLERQAHELAKALVESGVQVQALSGTVEPDQPSLEDVEGVLVHRIPWSGKKWLRFVRTPWALFSVLYAQRKTYDVVHLHQHSWFGLFTIVAARLLGKPILTKIPNVGSFGIPGLRNLRLGRFMLTVLLRSDALVAMSEESISELEGVGFPASRILATPNGIRLDAGRITAEAKGNHQNPCRVVFVGRLSAEKGLDLLLRVWGEVCHSAGHPAVLEIWGSGPLESELRRISKELSIDESVIFRGHVEGVRDQLKFMDVFVLNSRAEGNSNAILEAMAAGLPIVSTRVGGTPMLVGADGADLLLDPGDRATLAAHLLELIQDPGLRKSIGAAMQQRAAEYFDICRVAQTYTEAYRRLAAGMRDRISEVSNPVIREKTGPGLSCENRSNV